MRIAEITRLRRVSRLPIQVDPRLNERALGILEGTTIRRIEAYARGDLAYAPNQGESYLDLAQRLLSFLVDVRVEVQRQSRVLVATHAGPMRLLVGIFEGFEDARSVLALKFANAETYRCVLKDLRWPAFIRKEVAVHERHRHTVGVASRASCDS